MEKTWHAALLVTLACLLWVLPRGASAATPSDAERAWITNAARLVAIAVEGTAPITHFRRQVDRSRERLRRIFLADAGKSDPRRALHMQMLVLNSLLQAAASCHQAGRVSCPPSLISQLINQRNAVQQLAGMTHAGRAGVGL